MNRLYATAAIALCVTGCNLLWGTGDLTYDRAGGASPTTSTSVGGGGGGGGGAMGGGGAGGQAGGDDPAYVAHSQGTLDISWQLDSAAAMWNVDQFVCVRQRATATVWKLWLTFAGASGGSYVEVEADGQRRNGSRGDTARFQADHATAGRGAACPSETSPEAGCLCERAIALETDRCYRLRVWRLDADADGQWWGAWIRDEETLVEEEIGGLRFDSTATVATAVRNTVRYRGPALPCDWVPPSIADISAPGGNQQGELQYEYLGALAGSTLGKCTNGAVSQTDLGWASAAHVLLGGST